MRHRFSAVQAMNTAQMGSRGGGRTLVQDLAAEWGAVKPGLSTVKGIG